MLLSILFGVVAGVLTNVVTFLFVKSWLPIFQNYVYKGIRVEGDWIIYQDEEPADGFGLTKKWLLSANLEQRAYAISGQATATNIEEQGAVDVINYDLHGHIFDRCVSLVLRNKDATRMAYSVFLLEVTGAGSKMDGYRCFYGLRRNVIRSIECRWKRATHEIALEDERPTALDLTAHLHERSVHPSDSSSAIPHAPPPDNQ